MVYKHKYFYLDAESKKVYDENMKELKLTGNAFRLLVFLCQNQHAMLMEIGDYLDHAKEYIEDHIRQYKYKINTIISHNVVKYGNNVYFLEGKIEEIGNLPERNTDLLRRDPVKLKNMNSNSPEQPEELIRYKDIAVVIAGVMSLLALATWPYGYYIFLRWVVFVASGLVIYTAHQLNKTEWAVAGAITLLLFNPIAPISLDRSTWAVFNIVVAVMFFVAKNKIKK